MGRSRERLLQSGLRTALILCLGLTACRSTEQYPTVATTPTHTAHVATLAAPNVYRYGFRTLQGMIIDYAAKHPEVAFTVDSPRTIAFSVPVGKSLVRAMFAVEWPRGASTQAEALKIDIQEDIPGILPAEPAPAFDLNISSASTPQGEVFSSTCSNLATGATLTEVEQKQVVLNNMQTNSASEATEILLSNITAMNVAFIAATTQPDQLLPLFDMCQTTLK